jgi:hypothetical protein
VILNIRRGLWSRSSGPVTGCQCQFYGILVQTRKSVLFFKLICIFFFMNETAKFFPAHRDVWAHGQVKSKLWLCEHLERIQSDLKPAGPWVIWIYGAWYSMTAFLLLARDKCQVDHIRGLDVDPKACEAADIMNNRWTYEDWRFKAFVKDCNKVDFKEDSVAMQSRVPDLVINTSCEHFDSAAWWDHLPQGQLVALQSNDMTHDEHVNNCRSLEDFCARHPLGDLYFKGEMSFDYGELKFRRFMLIGKK